MTATPVLKLWEAGDAMEIVRVWIEEHDDILRANDGVFPDELAELLDKVETDFDRKAERVALFVRELQATAKIVKLEEERLYSRRKSLDAAADRLKTYLEMQMLVHQVPRIDGKLVSLRIQRNPPSVRLEREFSQEDLAAIYETGGLFAESLKVVRFIEPVAGHYEFDARALCEASKQIDDRGKIAGYESPIPGVVVSQGASLRIT